MTHVSQIESLACEVLSQVRTSIVMKMRFLDLAVFKLKAFPTQLSLATDGTFLYYRPIWLLKQYQEEPNNVTRDFMHILMHCIFRHPFVNTLAILCQQSMKCRCNCIIFRNLRTNLITGDKIAAATIEGSNIKAGTITTSNVAANFGQTLDLSSNVGINQRVQQIYTDMNAAIAAAGGGEIIVGTQASSTSAWTGVASFSTLTDGQQIVYWLPIAATSTAVTLELTLSGGGTTGAIPVYYSGTTRLTTHYAAGNAIRLIYKVDAPIGEAYYTGWWADANYDSGNTYDRIKLGNSVVCKENFTWAKLIVGDDTGYWNLAGGTTFNIDHPILYPAANGTAGKRNADGINAEGI